MDQLVTPTNEPERWLSIGGYEGLYEVSDLGRVRSLDRAVGSARGPEYRRGRVLAAGLGAGKGAGGRARGGPYLSLCLCRDGKRRRFNVHTLVARAFLGPRPAGLEVCHGPGGALDNRLVNLSYGTHSKNLGEDRYRDGTASAKLNDKIVIECRDRAAAGESIEALAAEFGVVPSTMMSCLTGKTWGRLPAA